MVEVPVVHSVTVESSNDANVEVSDFIESEFCQVNADAGAVTAKRIKTESLAINTNSGDIMCTGPIQGSIKLTSTSGNVISEQRVIGPSLDVSTESGDVRITSAYSDQVSRSVQAKFKVSRSFISRVNSSPIGVKLA